MAGGLFTIDAKWFEELGYYDPELALYGGENLELSFKVSDVIVRNGSRVRVAQSLVKHIVT